MQGREVCGEGPLIRITPPERMDEGYAKLEIDLSQADLQANAERCRPVRYNEHQMEMLDCERG